VPSGACSVSRRRPCATCSVAWMANSPGVNPRRCRHCDSCPVARTAPPARETGLEPDDGVDSAAKTVREAVAEYEAGTTIESRCARDADKLECLLQAIEYRTAGNTNVQGWVDSSRQALTTETAARIADAAVTMSPLAWRGR
jgi:hypothetical protein